LAQAPTLICGLIRSSKKFGRYATLNARNWNGWWIAPGMAKISHGASRGLV